MQNCIIENNTCVDFSTGIHVNEAPYCTIRYNTATDNTRNGINIRYSDYSVVTYNFLKDNNHHGFAIIGLSAYNVIHHNTFIDNSKAETYTIDGTRTGEINSQGIDEGHYNYWYDNDTKQGNFWSDYSGKGTYEIDGPANAVDIYPMQIAENTKKSTSPFFPIILSSSIIVILTVFQKRRSKNSKEL